MRRIIVSDPKSPLATNSLSHSASGKNSSATQVRSFAHALRRPTSLGERFKLFDQATHAQNPETLRKLIDEIRELAGTEFNVSLLEGLVGRCYLGPEYAVHTLDLGGGIVEHYHHFQPLPAPLEPARALAASGGYAYIEVYSDKMLCVSNDGIVTEIPIQKTTQPK